MRIRSARFLSLALAIGLIAPLFAQQPGRGGAGRGVTTSMLLGQKSVQEELKLTEDQVKKIETISKDLRTKYADDLKDFQNREKFQEAMKKMNEEQTKLLADVVKPEQMKRVKQIEVQVGGLRALTNEDVQKALKLTEKQIEQVKAMTEDLAKDSKSIRDDAGKDRAKLTEAMAKINTLSKEASAKFLSGLSADQKTAWKELTGDEFKGKIEFTGMGCRRPNQDK